MVSNLVEWRRFALEETKARNGKVLEKLNLVYKNVTSNLSYNTLSSIIL